MRLLPAKAIRKTPIVFATRSVHLLVVLLCSSSCTAPIDAHNAGRGEGGAPATDMTLPGFGGSMVSGGAGGESDVPDPPGQGGMASPPTDAGTGIVPPPLPKPDGGSVIPPPAPTGVPVFVRVSTDLLLETSCDGSRWQRPALPRPPVSGSGEANTLRTFSFSGGVLFAAGGGVGGAGTQKLFTSDDARTWVFRGDGRGNWIAGVGYLPSQTGGVWLLGGGNGFRMESRDRGTTWQDKADRCTVRDMENGNGRVLAACDGGYDLATLDTQGNVKWTSLSGGRDGVGSIAYGNGRFVATSSGGCFVLEDSATVLKPCNRPHSGHIVFADGWFYSNGGDSRWTEDGYNWVSKPAPTIIGGNQRLLAFASKKFVGASGRDIGVAWVQQCP